VAASLLVPHSYLMHFKLARTPNDFSSSVRAGGKLVRLRATRFVVVAVTKSIHCHEAMLLDSSVVRGNDCSAIAVYACGIVAPGRGAVGGALHFSSGKERCCVRTRYAEPLAVLTDL
jgi:hypothetical protein